MQVGSLLNGLVAEKPRSRSGSRWATELVLTCVIGFSASWACSRRVDDPPETEDLLPRREADCRALCEVMVGECGPLPNDVIDSVDTCIRECATPNGDLSGGWGYQESTEADACASEWKTHAQCIIDLSCEEQRLYWQPPESPPPPSDRPCYAEWTRMTECVLAHPCCNEP